MDFMRSWILSVTISAMLIAVAEAIMPSGSVKKVARLLGGLVLMLGILQPLVRTDFDDLFRAANGSGEITVESAEEQKQKSEEMLKTIIEEELCAYVLDKAQGAGIHIAVQISCEAGEDGAPIPARAEIRGRLDARQRQKVLALLQDDLGIPQAEQTYINEDVT